jgi:hypothetical protein
VDSGFTTIAGLEERRALFITINSLTFIDTVNIPETTGN